MKILKAQAIFIIGILLALCFTAAVSASTENKMRSVATTVRDKDFSEDPATAPMFVVTAENAIEKGSFFVIELSNSADWVFDDCKGPQFENMFTNNGGVYTSHDLNIMTNQRGLTYNVEQFSARTLQITLNDVMEKDSFIGIPMIVKIDGIAEAYINVSNGEVFGITSGGPYIFANKGNATDIKVDVSSNSQLKDDILTGDIFVDSTAVVENTTVRLKLLGNFIFAENKDVKGAGEGSYAETGIRSVSYRDSAKTMVLEMAGMFKSTSSGRLTIKNVKVIPGEKAAEGDVLMELTGFGVDKGQFVFGEYKKDKVAEEEPKQEITPTQSELVVTVTAGDTEITVNGKKETVASAPFIDSAGRMMVPLRFIAQAFGYTDISWDSETKTASVNAVVDGYMRRITFTVGEMAYSINGNTVAMDTAAVINNGYTFIPVRYAADALGIPVSYDPDTKTAEFVK